jgi:hypothetical protein
MLRPLQHGWLCDLRGQPVQRLARRYPVGQGNFPVGLNEHWLEAKVLRGEWVAGHTITLRTATPTKPARSAAKSARSVITG